MTGLTTLVYDALMKARCDAASARRTPSTEELTAAVMAVISPYIDRLAKERTPA